MSGRLRVQIPARPTLRVLKKLRRKCGLCNDICNCLDKKNKGPVSQHSQSVSCCRYHNKIILTNKDFIFNFIICCSHYYYIFVVIIIVIKTEFCIFLMLYSGFSLSAGSWLKNRLLGGLSRLLFGKKG